MGNVSEALLTNIALWNGALSWNGLVRGWCIRFGLHVHRVQCKTVYFHWSGSIGLVLRVGGSLILIICLLWTS